MRQISLFLGSACLLFAVSCDHLHNPFSEEDVIAKVGSKTLYIQDISSIFSPDIAPEDSLLLLRTYVDQWVKTQLKIREAEMLFESTQKDIDKLVEEYRNSILTHKIDQYCIDRDIDTLFTEEQIELYYQENKEAFRLERDLLQARIVSFPADYRQKSKLRDLMLSSKEQDYQDFVDICLKNKFELIELNQWSDMPTLLSYLPTERGEGYDYLLREDRIHHLKSGDQLYYVLTVDHRAPGDYTPIEFVREVIRRVIFNQRREAIIRSHEDSLYRSAVEQDIIRVNLANNPSNEKNE